MLWFILLVIVILVITVYSKYDAVSPKLVVRELATWIGYLIGGTPEVTKTTVKLIKTSNLEAEVAMREAGLEGPVGLREGTIISKRAVRTTLAPTNKALDERKAILDARLAELLASK